MFRPFLSAGKASTVECSKDCALYNGSMDGSRRECVIFSIGVNAGSATGWLKSIEKDVDEAAEAILRIERNLPED